MIRLAPIQSIATDVTPLNDAVWSVAYTTDTFEPKILQMLRDGTQTTREIQLSSYEEQEGHLYVNGRRYVPDDAALRNSLLLASYNPIEAGHKGRGGTFDLITRSYWWPGIYDDVKRYVRNCIPCKTNKPSRETYKGLLKPMPIALRAWKELLVDFVGPLPPSKVGKNTYRHIMVVVNRLTKMKILVRMEEITSKAVATAFLDNVWKLHGLPNAITSDRGPQFTLDWWRLLCSTLRIMRRLSTAFHPQTDGQTENTNQAIEAFLRHYINFAQDDWASQLPIYEFTLNNSTSASTGFTPFFANYGFHPRLSFDFDAPALGADRNTQFDTQSFAKRMEYINESLRDHLIVA